MEEYNHDVEKTYKQEEAIEIYRSGDYNCNNAGNDKCPYVISEDIFRCLLFRNSTILSYLWRILTAKRMTIKEFFSFGTNKFFWLNIAAMIVVVIVVIFGVLKWIDIYTHHGETVVVPDVKGIAMEEAAKMFQKQGLACMVSDTRYVKDKAAGVVLEMKPEAGEKVKEGRMVYLTVNTLDVPLRAIPDVADNSSFRQAQARLLSSGFKLNEVELVNGEKDWVYGVKYEGRELAAGDEVPVGASLTLIVGDGAGDTLESDSTETATDTEMSVASESSPEQEDSWF